MNNNNNQKCCGRKQEKSISELKQLLNTARLNTLTELNASVLHSRVDDAVKYADVLIQLAKLEVYDNE